MKKRPKKTQPTLKIVRVEWDDAAAHIGAGWIDIEDAQEGAQPLPCVAVGFLIEKSKKAIKLALNWSEGSQVADVMVIPRGMVKSIRRLR